MNYLTTKNHAILNGFITAYIVGSISTKKAKNISQIALFGSLIFHFFEIHLGSKIYHLYFHSIYLGLLVSLMTYFSFSAIQKSKSEEITDES